MGPVYVAIADEIERRVASGALRPGERAPSTRQITKEWHVAMATATKALAELRTRGIVRTRPGAGTVVTNPPPRPLAATAAAPEASVPAARRQAAAARPGTAARPGAPVPAGAAGEVTRARIISTAIAVADAEGIAAVTMRRIAIDLGVATMSLYHWVRGKDELLVGMLDAALGAGDWPTTPPPGWRAQLEYVARRQWQVYREHPWLAQVVSLTRPQLAPRAMMHTEWVLRALDGFDLADTTRLNVVLTLFGHVRGAAMGLEAERQAERDTGQDIEEWIRTEGERFTTYFRSGRYPYLAGLDRRAAVEFDLDALFEFGLRNVLDGLAALLEPPRS